MSSGLAWDDGGLPVHLPIKVDINGNGPVDDSDPRFDHWECWCSESDCTIGLEGADDV